MKIFTEFYKAYTSKNPHLRTVWIERYRGAINQWFELGKLGLLFIFPATWMFYISVCFCFLTFYRIPTNDGGQAGHLFCIIHPKTLQYMILKKNNKNINLVWVQWLDIVTFIPKIVVHPKRHRLRTLLPLIPNPAIKRCPQINSQFQTISFSTFIYALCPGLKSFHLSRLFFLRFHIWKLPLFSCWTLQHFENGQTTNYKLSFCFHFG